MKATPVYFVNLVMQLPIKSLPLTEPPVQFAGAITLEESCRGVMPWRIDHTIRDLFHKELVARAAMPAGVRICFLSNTQQVHLVIEPAGEGPSAEWIMDILLTRMMRNLPADAISLCLGINIQQFGSFSGRSFREQAIGTVLVIREGHPDIPIVVISPIVSPTRETTPGPSVMTLVEMRELLTEAVELMTEHGDRNLHYLSGLKLFNEGDLELLPDGLHPNAEGYKLMGTRAIEYLLPLLGLKA